MTTANASHFDETRTGLTQEDWERIIDAWVDAIPEQTLRFFATEWDSISNNRFPEAFQNFPTAHMNKRDAELLRGQVCECITHCPNHAWYSLRRRVDQFREHSDFRTATACQETLDWVGFLQKTWLYEEIEQMVDHLKTRCVICNTNVGQAAYALGLTDQAAEYIVVALKGIAPYFNVQKSWSIHQEALDRHHHSYPTTDKK